MLVCVQTNDCTTNFHRSEFWLHNKSWKCWPRSNRFNKNWNRFWFDILMHRKLRSSKASQKTQSSAQIKTIRNVIDKQKSKFLIDWIQIPKPMMECSVRFRLTEDRNESQNICFEFVNLQGKRMNRKNRCSFTFLFISFDPDAFDVYVEWAKCVRVYIKTYILWIRWKYIHALVVQKKNNNTVFAFLNNLGVKSMFSDTLEWISVHVRMPNDYKIPKPLHTFPGYVSNLRLEKEKKKRQIHWEAVHITNRLNSDNDFNTQRTKRKRKKNMEEIPSQWVCMCFRYFHYCSCYSDARVCVFAKHVRAYILISLWRRNRDLRKLNLKSNQREITNRTVYRRFAGAQKAFEWKKNTNKREKERRSIPTVRSEWCDAHIRKKHTP